MINHFFHPKFSPRNSDDSLSLEFFVIWGLKTKSKPKKVSKKLTVKQGRNQLFISGRGAIFMKFHDDVIVVIQPWYNFFANGHI